MANKPQTTKTYRVDCYITRRATRGEQGYFMTLEFGKYRGTDITAVPDAYLMWLRFTGDAAIRDVAAAELQRRGEAERDRAYPRVFKEGL